MPDEFNEVYAEANMSITSVNSEGEKNFIKGDPVDMVVMVRNCKRCGVPEYKDKVNEN